MARRTATRTRSQRDDYDPDLDETPDQSGAVGRYDDDDDQDERPARRSRGRSRQSDEDEAPRGRSRGRSRRDDDDDQDDAPRGRRSSRASRDDDDDQDQPRGRSRGGSSRGRDAEEPRRERGKSSTVGRGWGAVDKIKVGDYTNRWDVPEKPALIKFLEPEPFSVYAEHFIEELPKGTKKSYICLGDDCPLCDDLGDRPSSYAAFNILDLTDPDEPKVVFLRASVGLAKDIQTYAQDKRTKPINRWDVYFTLHRKRQQGARYKLEAVKARDLEDDFDMVPFEEDDLADFEGDLVTEEQVVFINTRKDLKDVVSQVDGYDD